MHIHRFAQHASAHCHALDLAPGAPVGAAWLALRPGADSALSEREGDCLVVAAHGIIALALGAEHQELSAGDAAVVHGARACTVRALTPDASALTVWLPRAAPAGGPRIVLQREKQAKSTIEFNTRFRRLPLLPESEPLDWGSALADIAPREATVPHSHIDNESFVLLTGHGRLRIDDEVCELQAGDVVHLPSKSEHTLENLTGEDLRFFCTWWTEGHPQNKDCIDQGKH
ncbi:cupin domain-containing protein [Ramlibacter sp.]|uniref:cupin domain-containing protein n=1 Tax=Ramlibacter sp. TaxID=1917967 RepID=UPI0025DBF992|nr:cupin domain-containing protein [Ramlibacter sp.]